MKTIISSKQTKFTHLYKTVLTCLALLLITISSASAMANSAPKQGERGKGVPDFWVRPGYKVTVAVAPKLLKRARFMAFGNKKTLFVSQRAYGIISAFKDKNKDGQYQTKTTFLKNKPKVQAMQWHDGWLWFATATAIGKARDTNNDGRADDIKIILKNLPGKKGHNWRGLVIKDGYLYTSIGDPGNITDQTKSDREKIWRYKLDGSDKTLWSSGIRNTEKLQFRPGTNELWGFDHGSDWFGKKLGEKRGLQPITNLNPPDELNHYIKSGFYGHPFIVGENIPRYEYLKKTNILQIAKKSIAPKWTDSAHWAPNGWTFISSNNKSLPKEQRGDIYVAFHGSWNRTKKAGYRIERVLFDKVTGKPYGGLKIVGTLGGKDKQKVLARPVDVVEAPDGSLLFSTDYATHIYRLQWIGNDK